MNFVVSVLAGIVWGGLAALVVAFCTRGCLEEHSAQSLARYKRCTSLVGVAALVLAFLLCRFLPLRMEAVLIGTVITMPLLNVLFMFRAVKRIRTTEQQTETEE